MGAAVARLKPAPAVAPAQRVHFVVLGQARSGTTLLVDALSSHPEIRCFREIFNWRQDFVDYQVDGYDKSDPLDLELRQSDPEAFLRERVFCGHPPSIRAVGFKLIDAHIWGFAGLAKLLAADRELLVVHIRRNNLLRELVSLRLAEATGEWAGRRRTVPAQLLLALRRPSRARGALAQVLRRLRNGPALRAVTLTREECERWFLEAELRAEHFERLFAEHPRVAVRYEELVAHRDETLEQVQRFLGVEPVTLSVTTRRQNPEPLRELLVNYDELREAFRGTAAAAFFD